MTDRTLTHYDQRTGDIYHIHLLGRRFVLALRHVGRVGLDPIVYTLLDEIPDGAKHNIEQLIEEVKDV